MALLSFTQESGESAEGAHAGPLPLRVPALPARGPAEGPDPHRAFCPLCPERSPLPPPAPLLLLPLLARSRPAPPHDAGLSHPNVPAQPQQRRCACIPPPGAHLPQPQPGSTAAVAVAKAGRGAAGVHPFCRSVQRGQVFLTPTCSHGEFLATEPNGQQGLTDICP